MRLIATMGTAALLMTATSMAQVSITEVRTGAGNTEYIELKGTPGASLGGLTLLIIGDGTAGSGVVEWRYPFAKTDVFGANGYLVLRNPGDAAGPFALTVDPGATDRTWPVPASGALVDSQIEGDDNQTILLVSGYTGTDTFITRAPQSGSQGQDLDTNNDGTLDVTPWASVVDVVVMKKSDGTAPPAGEDWWYEANPAKQCGPFRSRSVQTVTTGGVLGYWNQNSNVLPGGGNGFLSTAFPQAATSGSLTPAATLQPGGGLTGDTAANANGDVVYTWIESFGGSTLGALNNDASGGSICVEGGTGATAAGGGNNGSYLQINFSMAGQAGVRLKWATRVSGTTTAFNSQQVSYSTDGTNFTNVGDPVTGVTSNFSLQERDLGNVLDGAATAYVRINFSGASTSTSNVRIDNLQLLSQETTSQVIVNTFGAPVHGLKTAAGSWVLGNAAPAQDSYDTPGKDNAVIPTYSCGDAGSGDCLVAHANGSCADQCCCEEVCAADAFCCDVRWDSICAGLAANCSGSTNCGGSACAPDLNGDSAVDGQDLGVLLGSWGPVTGTVASDLNDDGAVDGQDLGVLLGAWGPCQGG
jgi:hypothetical protein